MNLKQKSKQKLKQRQIVYLYKRFYLNGTLDPGV